MAIIRVDHYVLLRQRYRQSDGVRLIDDISPEQTANLRMLHRNRSLFVGSLASAVTLSLYLVIVNLIISPSFPWSSITAAGFGLMEFVHYLGFSRRRKKLIAHGVEAFPSKIRARLLRRAGMVKPFVGAPELQLPVVARAVEPRDRLAARLLGVGQTQRALANEIGPLLRRYVEEIGRLAAHREEVRGLLDGRVKDELIAERARLAARRSAAEGGSLGSEYTRAIEQIDGRLESLRKRLEIADLRLSSSIGSPEHLEIEIVRMKSLSDVNEGSVSRLLSARVDELSEHVDDLIIAMSGLEQIGRDPGSIEG